MKPWQEKQALLSGLAMGLIGLIIIFGADYAGFYEGLDNYAYDLFSRLEKNRGPSERIVIVAIDEKSLEKFGKWPISRHYYASLLERLNKAQVVGFDIIMAEPSGDDQLLAQAIKRHGRVVLPVYIDNRMQMRYPVQVLSPQGLGHVHVEPDVDGVVRNTFHTLLINGIQFHSFAKVMANPNQLSKWGGYTIGSPEHVASPIKQADRMRISYYGPPGTFPTVSLADVIGGSYPPAFFANRNVLVGLTAIGFEDRVITPFTQNRSSMAGVEVQASILHNLLDGSFVREVSDGWRWMIALIIPIGVLFLSRHLSERNVLLLWLCCLFLIVTASFLLLSFTRVWLSPALLAATLSWVLLAAAMARFSEAAQRLDREYAAVASHLHQVTEEPQQRRLYWFLTTGGINEKVDMLTKVTDKLMEVNRMKSMFTATMSHELRTPLNSVIGFSSVLLKQWVGPLNEEQKGNLDLVLKAGKHLLSLINDVIDVSRIEAGQITPELEKFDLHEVVAEAVESLRNEIDEKGLRLMVENSHEMMHTDRRRLFQSLLNLLGNAVKYSEQGSITINVKALSHRFPINSRDDSGDSRDIWVEIAVIDTGIGIRSEDAAKLFQPFLRLDSPLRGKTDGTGLGLYLTRKLVTQVLGGELDYSSVYGQGSSFVIRIPAEADKIQTHKIQ